MTFDGPAASLDAYRGGLTRQRRFIPGSHSPKLCTAMAGTALGWRNGAGNAQGEPLVAEEDASPNFFIPMNAIADHTFAARAVGSLLARATSGEYLSFRLGAEEYGIGILKVQEIRGYQTPTRIVGAPVYVCGVLNLRGAIVPVVDLRLRSASKLPLAPPL